MRKYERNNNKWGELKCKKEKINIKSQRDRERLRE